MAIKIFTRRTRLFLRDNRDGSAWRRTRSCRTATGCHNSRAATSRRGGRVVDGSGLENRQGASPRGFESHPLRCSSRAESQFPSPESQKPRLDRCICSCELGPCQESLEELKRSLSPLSRRLLRPRRRSMDEAPPGTRRTDLRNYTSTSVTKMSSRSIRRAARRRSRDARHSSFAT
jgi:hypothetical protein